ncbi:anthranilate synthase component II [Leptospira yasudae]|uniref:Aminodeoxychorismate/anthranilate synthase component II n=1 Tax=Leptospira yasudae TaxID=2202201 RepID=A0A6N4QY89_9LEPT|nr:aminodeoxychorismate/anthranilate synthase component II [Leptospira yasudae]TGL76476.1 aminodeoxychorismate/anthranilate synthase component II [Leptospira yasudae]TGL83399.1 aminodeoxychorismate/anthranilate synthase component II [Leptospira yasudae]TGL89453.1 aminodeoxychorismate/anthranilate synthase component II [Leptospira yasudae]
MKNCIVVDHYDSFTYNLVHLLEDCLETSGERFSLSIFRQDQTDLHEILSLNPTHILLSPGPGHPEDPEYFGVSESILRLRNPYIKIFGVCLGMQGIVTSFGGRLRRSKIPFHGKTSEITHDRLGIFKGIPDAIRVMRYHSLEGIPESLPDCLEITASVETESSSLMGIRHKTLPIEGVQFHPESFATEGGRTMIENFLR